MKKIIKILFLLLACTSITLIILSMSLEWVFIYYYSGGNLERILIMETEFGSADLLVLAIQFIGIFLLGIHVLVQALSFFFKDKYEDNSGSILGSVGMILVTGSVVYTMLVEGIGIPDVTFGLGFYIALSFIGLLLGAYILLYISLGRKRKHDKEKRREEKKFAGLSEDLL